MSVSVSVAVVVADGVVCVIVGGVVVGTCKEKRIAAAPVYQLRQDSYTLRRLYILE